MSEAVTTRKQDGKASPPGPAAAPTRPETRQPLTVPGSQPPVSLGAMVVTAAAVIAALYFGREVFIPLALAVLLSFALSPIVTGLRRLGLPKAPAVLIVVAVALALLGGFAWLLFNQASSLAQDLPKYEYNLRQKIRLIRADTTGSGVLEQTADVLRHVQEEIQKPPPGGPQQAGTPAPPPSGTATAKPAQPVPVAVVDRPETPLQTIRDALGVVAAPLANAGTTASAATDACGNDTSSYEHPFALDPLSYVLVPGGTFEDGAPGWQLNGGARVVAGNETFYAHGDDERYSLYLPGGSNAVSPPVCVGLLDSVVRLYASNGGIIGLSNLQVNVIYKTALGLTVEHPVLGLGIGTSRWMPTLPMPLAADLTGPLSLDGLTTQVRFRFKPIGFGASYRIDDVYVDPLKYI